ncbi:hypothetical protein [Rhizosphaericola mali]|uniref:Uncharacterized protein n=1 Tax=Rhizosphaericola mali TaxID=2545455 RepID=A0A5P2FWQ4_9BACT|nr:hypothetical protein [Rhizosphaericola mali]QES87954.1 hypothetical protein E0W69_004495 [Rhizosphaericola mali]
MIFFYQMYDYVLGEKEIIATLKNETHTQRFTLKIITPARKFVYMSYGGGLVKISRLYDVNGQLIHARNYSDEIKNEVKNFKRQLKIPYFQLWKGFLYTIVVLIIAAIIFSIKNKIKTNDLKGQSAHLTEQLQALKPGQLYGISNFTDAEGNSVNGLPESWIKIVKIDQDTIYIQRSKQTIPVKAMFEMSHISSIKPKNESEWEPNLEKISYPFLKSQLSESDKMSYDAVYIGDDKEKYSGIVFTLKGAE